MKKIIFAILLTLSSFAEYPYFKFDSSKLKLSDYSYRRYVRPQLRSIKNDFYYIVKRITYTSQDFINLRENTLKLVLQFDGAYSDCKKNQKTCYQHIKEVIPLIQAIERNIKKLREDFISLPSKQYGNVDDYINLISLLDNIDNLNLRIQSYIQLLHLTEGTNFSTYTPHIEKYKNYVGKMYNYSNDAFIYIFPNELKPSFEQFLDNFLSPLELKMIPELDRRWFIDRLGDLNMQWNVFHMDLEKGQTGFPREYVRNVKVMHARWNSILKLMFY